MYTNHLYLFLNLINATLFQCVFESLNLFYFLLEYTLDIDECGSNSCGNSSNCTDGVNGYTCFCDSGYTGVNCDIGLCFYYIYTESFRYTKSV